jgi:hypothetical protein
LGKNLRRLLFVSFRLLVSKTMKNQLAKANQILKELLQADAWTIDESGLITSYDFAAANGIRNLEDEAIVFVFNCLQSGEGALEIMACDEVAFNGHDLSCALRVENSNSYRIPMNGETVEVRPFLQNEIPAEVERDAVKVIESPPSRALGQAARKQLLEEYSDVVGAHSYSARLDYKAWGKTSSLWCFFTLTGSGKKIAVNCFRSRRDGRTYGPRDDSVDFSVAGNEGQLYDIHLTLSKSGHINMATAKPSNINTS